MSRPYTKEAIDEARLLLAVPPDSSHGLIVVRRIPVGIEHDETIGPDQIQTATAGLGAQHEYEIAAVGIVEVVHDLCSLLYAHRTVEPDVAILAFGAEFLEQIESLRVIRHQNYFVRRRGLYQSQQAV